MTQELSAAVDTPGDGADDAYLMPCSSGQHRLWLLEQLEPGGAAAHVEHVAVRMRGPLDADALERSVNVLVERHETLRTGLIEIDGEPVQAIRPQLTVPLVRVDLTGRPEDLDTVLRERVLGPFRLEQAPLFRVALVALGPDEHAFVIAFHHAVYDQWSGSVFLRDLLTCYKAVTGGAEPDLPELPIQYGDFAAWQRERAGDGRERAELDHWARRLWELPVLDLPTDRPRPAVRAHHGATLTGELPADVVRGLGELSRAHGATPFMTALAAFGAVLHRWSGQDDIPVGTPVAGRDRPEVQDLVGFFVNNLVLRTDLSGDPAFERLLERVRGTCLDAYAHATVPFERLVEHLAPSRDPSRSPLFQVMFVFGNVPMPETDEPGLPRLEMLRTDTGAAKFDVFFALVPQGDAMRVVLEYDTDLFDASTAERLLDHYGRLLAAAVRRPDLRLSELPLASPEEERLLAEWGTGPVRDVPEATVPEQVAARAAAHPDRVAVATGDRSLTYAQLCDSADAIATRLVAAGVAPGDRVAVALRRGPELAAALLGVLRAGAAYVPLDPAHPAARLRLVLEDAGPRALLTTRDLHAHLPADGVPALLLDAPDVPAPQAGLPGFPRPADPAYVVYTSGSTGRPKGVVVPHRALTNLLHSTAHEPGLTGDDVLAAVTTVSFDIAALELFLPLVTGARVEIVPTDETADGELLTARLRACRATALQATPTTFRLLLDAGWQPPARFTALCGGEAMPSGLGARLAATGADVWNMYGPSETTVWSTAHPVRGDGATDPVPLGRPLAHTVVRVAGPDGEPRPLGATGELWIGGAGLADGYLNRPELTAERFVERPDGRWYRTGDLTRYRTDGRLEFLGRADFQIKLRGFRIELGEIESVLAAHPAVREAVAHVREDNPGDPRLAAYLVLGDTEGQEDTVAAVRAHAADALPAPMVPATYTVLDALPLTANRKVDRAALPAPDATAVAHPAYEPPRTHAEREIAQVWCDVLGIDRAGVHDDFFALGGHSLLASRVAARLRARLGVDLPVRTVFRHPVLADLAARLPAPDEDAAAAATVPALPREPEKTGPHAGTCLLPASFQQRRVWFLHQLDPDSASAYVMHGAQRLTGPLDVEALRGATELLARRHETLRTSFTVVGDEPVQIVHPEPVPLLDVVDLTGRPGDARHILRERAERPFDLAAPPLARVVLLRLAPEEHILQVVVHHSVSDRLTIDVLTRELAAACTALHAGDQPRLPDLPIQYGDYADWQRTWLAGPEPARQIEHWRERLAGLPVLDLPTDAPRPAAPRYTGATATFDLPPGLTRRLTALAERHDATLFMVMLAGYALLLSRWSGQDDFAVGSPIDSRTRPELENLVGYLTNNMVLRTDLTGDPTVAELLGRVRETCLDAYAHADVPFEKIVEELRPDRDLARAPLFQAMFIAVHLGAPGVALPGVRAELLPPVSESAKYELTFTAFPHEGGQRIVAEYRTDLFRAATVERMLRQYATALERMCADDTHIGALDVLPDDEHATLRRWGSGPALDIPEVSLPGLLAPSFTAYADRVAVGDGEHTLTYAELDARANRLARRLRAEGAGPGTFVALFMERCPDLMVALLGVLRSGAAYVPMEVNFPPDRLRYLLEDSGAALVLTQRHLAADLPDTKARVLRMDADWADIAREPADPLPDGPGPGDLAYVIYTSGSTGRPKGVVLPHRPVVNFLLSMRDEPGMRADDVVAAANTVSCDMPVLDLYLPLLCGARIETVPLADVLDGEQLSGRLRAAGVTYLQGTPTTWRLLQETGWTPPDGFMALAGAEKVPADLAHWLIGAGATVWHLYGPTETTVWSTVHRARPEDDPLPLGHAVANTDLLVLDPALRRTPIGVPGELYIGGDGLAVGYLHRDELTRERFVPDPRDPAGRLYRTGDLVRHDPEGNIQFLGRTDFQVKLRGFRIELGEIESLLRDHPAVRDCVVTVREDTPGDPRLVGYVVPDQPCAHDTLIAELDDLTRTRLPAHMVPRALVVLEELPLTLNRNKVDRAKLPAPGADQRTGRSGYVEPRDDKERAVAAVWARLLDLDRVGVHDDFFALGGHSLLATRLVTALRDATGGPFTVRSVFERPTVAAQAELLAGDGVGQRHAPIPVLARDAGDHTLLPASAQQRRVWFLDRLAPHSAGAYLMRGALRLRGRLDVGALQDAVDLLVQRHETLRTALVTVDGAPMQRVARHADLPVRHVDLAAVPADRREERLRGLLEEEAERPLPLDRAPLARITLVRLSEEEHVLAVVTHHAVSDRLSTEIMVKELAAAYAALTSGNAPELPAPPVQYADYAAWQEDRLTGTRLAEEIAHWSSRLGGVPPLDLHTDRQRPNRQTYRGATRSAALPRDLADALARLAAEEDATPFMVLLTVFGALLHRMSGQPDFAIGTPDSGRGHPQLDGVLGYFANTLVLRSDATGDPTFRTLLRRRRDTCLDAYDHADVPFERLVEELRPDRDPSRSPLFQVLFILMPLPAPALHLPGVTAETVDMPGGGAKFDLTLIVQPGADGADDRLQLEYNGDLFDDATAERMLHRFLTLATAAVADPDGRLSDLPVLSASEERTLDRWDTGAPAEPATRCVTQLFETHAARTPERAAVRHGSRQLTYGELNTRANRLAHRLRARGARPGSRVVLATERSVHLFAGLLGILKAGAVYVPLDPSHPAERVRALLASCGADLLVTTADDAGRVPDGAPPVVLLDADDLAGEPDTDPEPAAGPDDLAYVIHTSGSTGRPKGVEISHGSLAGLLDGLTGLGWIGPDDRMAAPTTPAFDLSVPDLFLPLVTGAAIEIVPPDEARDGAAFARRLRDSGVTVMQATPTTWQLLLDAGWQPPARFTAVCGGERVPVDVARRLVNGGATVWHMYGPTEATVWATAHRVTGTETRLPLGRPLPGVRLRVTDGEGRRAPVGVPGELWLAGPQLARGYHADEQQTRQRFVTHDGSRWYRTGDIVRHGSDGALEFVGRDDTQIKLRGHRVELGEIEAVLNGLPQVAQAVVTPYEAAPGDLRLVTHLVPAEPGAIGDDGRDVLRAAARLLPSYMVPAAAVVLDRLPLTANRKVDRAALPAPGGPAPHTPDDAPTTPTEQRLVALFAEALGTGHVGVHDDFFTLGGHSLLAARLHARIEREWPAAPGVRALFDHPTAAALAAVLDAGGQDTGQDVSPETDTTLDDDIRPAPPRGQDGPPRHILLTGGTGFLGAFVLTRLLTDTTATVHCLVRASDPEAGRRRLVDHLTALHLWNPDWAGRVEPVCGDLAEPRLGLTDQAFRTLAGRVDLILHGGAVVNYALPYRDLRAANVHGTREILRLACAERATPVHLVSSRAVFGRARGGAALLESDLPTTPPYDDNGYAQSKWTGEHLAREAARRGLPVAVHRPGRIAGDSRTGLWQSEDVACHLMRACALTGLVPDTALATDLVPVEKLADAITALALRPDALGETFHYAPTAKTPLRLLAEALPPAGHTARLVPPGQWLAAVTDLADRHPHDAGLALVVQEYAPLAREGADDFQEPVHDCATTTRLLGRDAAFPAVDTNLLTRYLRALTDPTT
ncbi:amino acid adenylation domain-containing protein [Streptomyces sp. NPDC005925]|uniref:non-ribosomal peptide synthetase n=1 Tax=Streptomyces sp. NPDC005925 TaxID=3157172 RepID=UPI0033D872EB